MWEEGLTALKLLVKQLCSGSNLLSSLLQFLMFNYNWPVHCDEKAWQPWNYSWNWTKKLCLGSNLLSSLFPGFVCNRKDLSASGCCHSGGESTKRYECRYCQNNNCCSIYEHCVSCCLNPDNVSKVIAFLQLFIFEFSKGFVS